MAKPNYSFAKRQRDLAKKQKKEEKLRRKAGAGEARPQDDQPQDDQPQDDPPQTDQPQDDPLQGVEPLPTGNEEPAT